MKRIAIAAFLLIATGAALGFCLEATRESPVTPVAGVSSDPAVASILSRSCQDCHSDNTRWPWYSRIPPIGAYVRRDVRDGRKQLNLSHWAQYGPDDKNEALAEIAALVRNRLMPPARYTLLHPEARLSADEVQRLTKWTLEERRGIAAGESRKGGRE